MPRSPRNTGVILEAPKSRDWQFGGVSGGVREVLVEDGQWLKFLPRFEAQSRYGLETMSCVSQSLCNCLETYFKAAFDLTKDFNDRFLAKISGTTRKGNTFWNVSMAAHKKGLSDEGTWPWTQDVDTWDEYYGEPSSAARESAMRFLGDYETFFEWVDPKPETMIDALKYGPLQVCSNGHAYEVYGYDPGVKWDVFDTYGDGMRDREWDHRFDAAMLHTVAPLLSDDPLLSLANDCLVFEGGGPGRVGLHVNGKMFVDDPALIQLQWHTRNEADGMFVGGPVRTIPQDEFMRFSHFDLKNNPL